MRTTLLIVSFLTFACGSKQEELREETSTLPAQADTITIATFNIRIFSNASRDNNELKQIADILQRYDLTAIQELRDTLVLMRMVSELASRNLSYAYQVSSPVGSGTKERYAFLYRTDKVSVVNAGKFYIEHNDEFIREPYYAAFKAGNFDFTIITIHVLFGSSEAERRPEIVELANVFQSIQAEDPAEQDVILVGDFNFGPDDVGWNNLKSIQSMTWLINPPAKTTISDASLYDNFWFQSDFVKEYAQVFGVYRYDEEVFGNNDQAASLAVSDHRPVWVKFVVSGQDDD